MPFVNNLKILFRGQQHPVAKKSHFEVHRLKLPTFFVLVQVLSKIAALFTQVTLWINSSNFKCYPLMNIYRYVGEFFTAGQLQHSLKYNKRHDEQNKHSLQINENN